MRDIMPTFALRGEGPAQEVVAKFQRMGRYVGKATTGWGPSSQDWGDDLRRSTHIGTFCCRGRGLLH